MPRFKQRRPENPFREGPAPERSTADAEKDWMVNWIGGRKEQLKENLLSMPDSYWSIYGNSTAGKIGAAYNRRFKADEKTHQEVKAQQGLIRSLPVTVSPTQVGIQGQYNTGTREVIIYNDAPHIYAHEYTHGMGATPQHQAVRSITGTPNARAANTHFEKEIETFLSLIGRKRALNYFRDIDETYSRLNEIRRYNNLKPSEVITLERLKEIKEFSKEKEIGYPLFQQYDDETLLRLFNEVADSGQPKTQHFASSQPRERLRFGGGGVVPKDEKVLAYNEKEDLFYDRLPAVEIRADRPSRPGIIGRFRNWRNQRREAREEERANRPHWQSTVDLPYRPLGKENLINSGKFFAGVAKPFLQAGAATAAVYGAAPMATAGIGHMGIWPAMGIAAKGMYGGLSMDYLYSSAGGKFLGDALGIENPIGNFAANFISPGIVSGTAGVSQAMPTVKSFSGLKGPQATQLKSRFRQPGGRNHDGFLRNRGRERFRQQPQSPQPQRVTVEALPQSSPPNRWPGNEPNFWGRPGDEVSNAVRRADERLSPMTSREIEQIVDVDSFLDNLDVWLKRNNLASTETETEFLSEGFQEIYERFFNTRISNTQELIKLTNNIAPTEQTEFLRALAKKAHTGFDDASVYNMRSRYHSNAHRVAGAQPAAPGVDPGPGGGPAVSRGLEGLRPDELAELGNTRGFNQGLERWFARNKLRPGSDELDEIFTPAFQELYQRHVPGVAPSPRLTFRAIEQLSPEAQANFYQDFFSNIDRLLKPEDISNMKGSYLGQGSSASGRSPLRQPPPSAVERMTDSRDFRVGLDRWLQDNQLETGMSNAFLTEPFQNIYRRHIHPLQGVPTNLFELSRFIDNLPAQRRTTFFRDFFANMDNAFHPAEYSAMRRRYNTSHGISGNEIPIQATPLARTNAPQYSATTPPPPRNISRMTREEAMQVVKDKESFSKINDEDFLQTVVTPKGEVVPYEPNFSTLSLAGEEAIASTPRAGYIKKFNENIGRLNEIIRKNRNKSGSDYTVKELSVDPSTGQAKLIFENPAQSFVDGAKTIDMPAGSTAWDVRVNPGSWKGTIKDIANPQYFRSVPGIEMSNSSQGVFPNKITRKGTGTYKAINDYLKELELGRVKTGFNSHSATAHSIWEGFIKAGDAVGYYANKGLIYGVLKNQAPFAIPTAGAYGMYQNRQDRRFRKQPQ